MLNKRFKLYVGIAKRSKARLQWRKLVLKTEQKGTQYFVHDYRNRIVRATEGGTTVKVDEDQFWGFIGDRNAKINSYQQWKKKLWEWYGNIAIKPDEIQGFYGWIRYFNYYKLAQAIFDLRNNK